MVTNWCPLSRRRSTNWKWVSSTSSRTLTSQRSPSPSTQPSRVWSRRPLMVAESPQSRTSVDPWVTLPSSMPYRRTSVDGSGRYKRWELASSVVWCDACFNPWGTELPIEEFLVLIDRLPSLFIVGTHPVTWLLPNPSRALWAVGVVGDLHMYINICGMHVLPMCQVHVHVHTSGQEKAGYRWRVTWRQINLAGLCRVKYLYIQCKHFLLTVYLLH